MIDYNADDLRRIFPRAPQTIIDAFCAPAGKAALDGAGITTTRTRLAFAFAEVEHESGGWTIRNLTENINYTPERAAQIWPSRFPGGADQVRGKYGTAPGWQLKMFDDVYGKRMGNRPGSHDGSAYIGRGGPQVTGRDGYQAVGKRTGLALEDHPELACRHELQPQILAAFWSWKNLNTKADAGDFRGCTKLWNGGLIGEADREHLLAGNDPIVARLQNVERAKAVARDLPGAPPTPAPPPEVIAAATARERTGRAVAIAAGGTGAASEVSHATVQQLPKASGGFMPHAMAWSLVGFGVAAIVVVAVLIARKRAAIVAHWI